MFNSQNGTAQVRFRKVIFWGGRGGHMQASEPNNVASSGSPGTALALAAPATRARAKEMTPEERAEFDRAVERIEQFPREFGWLMIYVGVLGIILPGVVGVPLVVAGGAVLLPGGRRRLSDWVARNPSRLVIASLKQIVRMADDLERRYPSTPGKAA
jgi:hypothetical protein